MQMHTYVSYAGGSCVPGMISYNTSFRPRLTTVPAVYQVPGTEYQATTAVPLYRKYHRCDKITLTPPAPPVVNFRADFSKMRGDESNENDGFGDISSRSVQRRASVGVYTFPVVDFEKISSKIATSKTNS